MAKRSVSADINRPVSVTVTGGGVAATGGGGGSTLPGTITPTTGNTVTGNHHTHRMLPTHAALPDIGPNDHHAPVTIGNTGLFLSGQDVSLRLATVSGLEISSGLRLADSIAGDGLTIASKVLSIDLATNSGLQLSGSPAKLHLRTPSSLDATTANTVTDVLGHTHNVTTGSAGGLSASTVNAEGTGAALARADHGHAITAYSDLATYPAHLAKADALGDSTWHRIDLTDRLRAPLIDSAAGQGLTIAPDEDLSLSPVSGVVKATSGVAVGTDNFVSQTTGWRAAYDGGADFRYLYADELHAKSFITDLEQALAGGQIISKSVAVIAVDFTVPAAGAAGTLTVEDLPGANGQAVFQDGDMVRLRQFTRGSGSLSIANCWGVVTGYSDNGDGTQSWTFTRSSGARAGTATAGSTIPARSLALDYGTSGNGFYEVNAIDGVWAQNSPYAQVVTWATHPADGQVVRSRWGNLRGIFAQADDFGLYAAVAGHTDADQYLRISSLGAVLHNLPLELYASGDKVLALDPAGPSLALGNPIPTGWLTQTGLWAGNDGGTHKHYVGQVSGGALVKGASWDGTSYNVVGNLIVGPGVGYVVDSALLHLPFDGPVPYETDFHVDLSGHVGQKPTAAWGGIIGRPGKFGKAVQLAEATTNLIGNPTMREPGWWWYEIGAGSITQEYLNDAAALGGKVLRATLSGCTSWTHFFRANGETLAPNTTYTVRFRLRASQARSIIFWVGRPDYPYSQYLIHGFSATTEWQEFSFTQTTPADTTNGYIYVIEAGSNPPDMWFELDYCQVEAKAYPTPIAEGSMGPGHAWTGTAHASTSTRAATDLYYEQSLPAADGTISAWVKEESAIGVRCVVRQDRSGSTYVILRYTTTGVEVYWGQIAEAIIGLCARDKDWHHLVVTRSGTLVSVYRDGVLLTSATMSAIGSPTTATTVGQAPGPAEWINGYIDDLLILDRALTADEVRQLYTSGRPVTVTGSPHSLLLTGPGRGKVEGHAGGLFGWDGASQPMWGFCNEDGVSFGGATLYAGDALIGDVAGGNYIQWDASAKKLTVRGDVAVTGSVSVAWSEITNKPDGAVRLTTGTPGSAGLWLTGSYMGYFDGSSWPVYIANNGRFRFSADANNYVKWDGSTFEVKGRIVITGGSGIGNLSDANLDNVADGTTYGRLRKTIIGGGYIQVGSGTKDSTLNGWHIGSTEIVGQKAGADQVVLDTSGAILAGGGDVRLDGEGIVLTARTTIGSGHSGICWRSGSTTYGSIETTTDALMEQRLTGTSPDWHTIIYSGSPPTPRGVVGLSYISFLGRAAFTVRSDSFASVLEAVTSGTGAGHVLIGGATDDGVNTLQVNGPSIFGTWMAADRAMVREIAAPPAIAGWIQIFGDSADGDLKVRFPNGTIKTIQTN